MALDKMTPMTPMTSITAIAVAGSSPSTDLAIKKQPNSTFSASSDISEQPKKHNRIYIVEGGSPRTLYAKDMEKYDIGTIKVAGTDVTFKGKFDAKKIIVKNGSFKGKDVTTENLTARKSEVQVADITEGAKVRGTKAKPSTVTDGEHQLNREEDATRFSGKIVPALAQGAVIAADLGAPLVGLAVAGGAGVAVGFIYGGLLCPSACNAANNMDEYFDTNFDYKAKNK